MNRNVSDVSLANHPNDVPDVDVLIFAVTVGSLALFALIIGCWASKCGTDCGTLEERRPLTSADKPIKQFLI